MNVLFNAFVGSLMVAGIACVVTFLGWLAVQWLGNWHYLFGEGGKYGKHSGD